MSELDYEEMVQAQFQERYRFAKYVDQWYVSTGGKQFDYEAKHIWVTQKISDICDHFIYIAEKKGEQRYNSKDELILSYYIEPTF